MSFASRSTSSQRAGSRGKGPVFTASQHLGGQPVPEASEAGLHVFRCPLVGSRPARRVTVYPQGQPRMRTRETEPAVARSLQHGAGVLAGAGDGWRPSLNGLLGAAQRPGCLVRLTARRELRKAHRGPRPPSQLPV